MPFYIPRAVLREYLDELVFRLRWGEYRPLREKTLGEGGLSILLGGSATRLNFDRFYAMS